MPRTIAIGDVHGCEAALLRLLVAVDLAVDDTLVMLGDYVDRGPDSQGVISALLALRSRCRLITLLGNHEQMMLSARHDEDERRFWLQFGGRQTLASYGGSDKNIPQEHWQFLKNCEPFFETDNHFFVHANYEPRIPLDQQTDHYRYWLHVEQAPRPHVSGKRAIVGHTAQRSGEVLHYPHLICIDTCCHARGWLTALDVDAELIWQADKNGKLRTKTPQMLPPARQNEFGDPETGYL